MSEVHIQNALRAIEAWNREDRVAFIGFWHPEAEWRPAFPKGTEGTGNVFRGHEGIEEAWRNVREAWDESRVEARRRSLRRGEPPRLGADSHARHEKRR
jgi:hypothetical protein